eukprot:scaffold62692_cov56-Attheya_sp.AAC.1
MKPKQDNRECQRLFTRMTVSTIAGENVIHNVPRMKGSKKDVLSKGCNKYISSLVHKDSNDVGKGGILHPKHSPTRYKENGRHIVSGTEGLAVLPDKPGDEVFTLRPP